MTHLSYAHPLCSMMMYLRYAITYDRSLQTKTNTISQYSSEESAGPTTSSTSCSSEARTGRLLGSAHYILSRLESSMKACTSSPTCSTFSYETPNAFESPYDSSGSNNYMDETTHGPVLQSRKQMFRNDDHDQRIEMKLEDDSCELDDRPNYQSGRSHTQGMPSQTNALRLCIDFIIKSHEDTQTILESTSR
jgi:hypothetical protein